MQKLQLYLGSDRIDLFGDESVSITQTIQNVRDISKVFTDFSKTFSVPASKKNNLLFKHYYSFNIIGGFDALNKVEGSIELNSIPFKSGFIRLEGVDLRKEKAYSYRITFFGNTVNLKDIIGEDMLSSLGSLSIHNLIYSPTEVFDRLKLNPITSTTKIIAPLITHTKRLFYDSGSSVAGSGNVWWHTGGGANEHGVLWSDLKYAIRIDAIITAIEEQYEIEFHNAGFFYSSNPRYYNLYMWLHRKSGAVQPATQVVEYFSEVNEFAVDISNKPYAVQTATSMRLYQTASYVANLILSPSTGSTQYRVIVYRNGASYFESAYGTGAKTFGISDWGEPLPIGTYTVTIVTNQSNSLMSFPSGNISWDLETFGVFSFVFPTNAIWVSSLSIEFVITQQIPEQKVIDFLNGLFNLFNLTAYTLDGKIMVQPIDDYYASGTTYDITPYLEVTKSKVDVALPYKQVNFEYEGLGTFLAKQYEQLNNVGWGTLRYTLEDALYDAPTEIYTVKPPFEHAQFERLFNASSNTATTIQYGYFTNENEQPYFGKPLLFYPVLIITGTELSFLDSETSHTDTTTYNIPSNSIGINSLNSGHDNLNFGAEINEYALTSQGFSDNSLFRKEYIDYVSAVFNTKRRITKAKAFLPLRIVIALELNDKITMRNETYIINSVTTNLQTGESDFELLNVV